MAGPTKPRIAIGADHAGYHAEENIKRYLEQAGYVVDEARAIEIARDYLNGSRQS